MLKKHCKNNLNHFIWQLLDIKLKWIMNPSIQVVVFFTIIFSLIIFPFHKGFSQNQIVQSPDKRLQIEIMTNNGVPYYKVTLDNQTALENSPLGLITNFFDLSKELKWIETKRDTIDKTYTQDKIKKREIRYVANELTCSFANPKGKILKVVFRVSNHNIAFQYQIPQVGDTVALVVEKETTGFKFPQNTKGFLTHQSPSMVGYMRTKPSYEEGYHIESKISEVSPHGLGYTFPCLFRGGNNLWTLISETGVRSLYCGSHLSDSNSEGVYNIAFPEQSENNGFGSSGAAIGLPAETPWRTITVGNGLQPIVETTIAFDVVEPLYKPSIAYQYGKGTWSWIMWQDASMNYEDQVKYIDLAAALGFKFILIDAWWDSWVGYQRTEELIKYARSKNVGVFLWYNSNGVANDAPQTPKNKMNTSIARKQEMRWMKENGVKGIKVDFLGGDKQEAMKLYEDILSDANDYGLMVVFHGATLPRGWERMFPNYVGSEAVLASENLMFSQHANDTEAFHASLHPFIRNAIGSMEFGGVVLNKRYSKTNDKGNTRKTTDIFQLATAVLFQNPLQFMAIAPNNLEDAPKFAIDFVKEVPTTWDETLFLDGYPGKYCVLARRNGDKWYIVGINAQKEPLKLELTLPMLAGETAQIYADNQDLSSYTSYIKVNKKGRVSITIQSGGGIVLVK
jgi:hypothetical protein